MFKINVVPSVFPNEFHLKSFLCPCPRLGKSQNLFLAFAQLWASLKFFFWRLPSVGQVSNSFFIVCRSVGKSQNIFLMFAQLWASLKIFFCRLPSVGQVPNSFFIVCRSVGKLQILFLRFAECSANLSKVFCVLSVATACDRCGQGLVTGVLFHLSFAIGNHL